MKNNKFSGIISLIVAVALMFAVVFGVKALSNPSANETAEEGPKTVDGTYTGSAQGFGGVVTATVTIEQGHIADVKISGDDETPALGGKAMETLPQQIVEAQSADVDAYSGATITSNAIIESVKKAIAKSQQ